MFFLFSSPARSATVRWLAVAFLFLTGGTVAGASENLPGRVTSVLRSSAPDENARWQGGPSSGNPADFDKIDDKRRYSRDTPFGTRCLQLNVDDPVPFSGWRKLGWDKIDKVY